MTCLNPRANRLQEIRAWRRQRDIASTSNDRQELIKAMMAMEDLTYGTIGGPARDILVKFYSSNTLWPTHELRERCLETYREQGAKLLRRSFAAKIANAHRWGPFRYVLTQSVHKKAQNRF